MIGDYFKYAILATYAFRATRLTLRPLKEVEDS